ncbi:hypothetical protein Hanom_Chr10g00949591 [Helianthus anomalus]
MFFLNGQRISYKWAIIEIQHIGIHSPPNRGNPHLGSKPVNTRSKARQCGEVKPAQFKNRTSDLQLFA